MKLSRILLILALAPVLLTAAMNWSQVELDNPHYFVQNRIGVRFADHVDIDAVLPAVAAVGAVERSRIEKINKLFIELPRDVSLREALEHYEAQADVLYAEPVAIVRMHWTPNDPLFGYQWQMQPSHLNMPEVWDVQRGSSSVVVGILDTGVAYEDYAIPANEADSVYSDDGYYHMAPDFTSSQFVAGYDCVNEDSHPNDMQGHGTHVAGTVAQATNNAIGVAGFAHNCRIMPVRVLGPSGAGTTDDLEEGIYWATDNGADVINMSLGWQPGIDTIILHGVHEAIIYANDRDVVICVSAGNEGVGVVSYPAAFPECISVAATDYNNQLSYYSQYGSGLDISAPGGDTDADDNNDGYDDGILQPTFIQSGDANYYAVVDSFAYWFWQGTSMASPHVAALAALLISNGVTGVDNVKEAIYNSATDLGATGYDNVYGHGLINPLAALNYDPSNSPPYAPATPSGPSSADAGTQVTFTSSTTDPEGNQVSYQFDWGDGNFSSWTSYVSSGTSQSVSHTYSYGGTYSVRVKARDETGAESGWSSGASITISGDVGLAIPVLQNPLLSAYIDIWVVPTTGQLSQAPTVTVTLGGSSQTVSMSQVSGTNHYVGDYKFTATGTAQIAVSADGQNASRSFTVSSLAYSGGSVASIDGLVKLDVLPGTFTRTTWIALAAEQPVADITDNPYGIVENTEVTAIGPAYRIGAQGKELDVPATVSISYSEDYSDPSSLVVSRYHEGQWFPVETVVDRKNKVVLASIDELGIYQLTSDPNRYSPDKPEATELTLASSNLSRNVFGIKLSLSDQTMVEVDIYDSSGRRVSTLASGYLAAGKHNLSWTPDEKSGSGIYFCKLKTPQGGQTLKLVRLH